MKKHVHNTKRSRGRKASLKAKRKLLVEFRNHHELLLKLSEAINAVSTHLGATSGAGRLGEAVAATEKTFIGYDEALKIVLECSGRTGP